MRPPLILTQITQDNNNKQDTRNTRQKKIIVPLMPILTYCQIWHFQNFNTLEILLKPWSKVQKFFAALNNVNTC